MSANRPGTDQTRPRPVDPPNRQRTNPAAQAAAQTAAQAAARALRALRGGPFSPALLAVLTVHLLGTLPAQVTWADQQPFGHAEGTADRLRLLTVSPVLRLSPDTGLSAVLNEVLWTGLFLLLLASGASALASRTPKPHRMPVVGTALLAFAPLAQLLALTFIRLPELSSDPPTRGAAALQLLQDASTGIGHALLLGAVGAVVAWIQGIPDLVQQLSESLVPTSESVDSEPGLDRSPDPSRGQLARLVAAQLVGPPGTAWPRIGGALLATAGAASVLALFAAELPTEVLAPALDFWCGPADVPDRCADELRQQITGTLPSAGLLDTQPLLSRLVHLYAGQAFVLLCAFTYFTVRRTTLGLPRAAGVAFSAWTAYTAGAVIYVAVLQAGIDTAASPAQALPYSELPRYLLPPEGFEQAVYAAPVAAAFAAGAVLLATRITESGDGRRTSSRGRSDLQKNPGGAP